MAGRKKPRGYFTREARKILEELWEEEYGKLGTVNRWTCRDEGWERAKETIGIGIIEQLAYERWCSSEVGILNSNQKKFRGALNTSRAQLASQGILPIEINNLSPSTINTIKLEIHTQLWPIRDLFLKEPGDEQTFSQIATVRDVDFNVSYDMVVIRDDNLRVVGDSREDYELLDSARRALKATKTQTLGQVFDLYDQG